MCANPACRKPLPYKSRRRYCNRACYAQAESQWMALDAAWARRELARGRTLVGLATELQVTPPTLRRALYGGAKKRPAITYPPHWRNPRQLSLF